MVQLPHRNQFNTSAFLRRVLLLLGLTCGILYESSAQLGNEWIQYDQPYWSFQVASDGIYRIPYEAIAQSGMPLSGLNPDYLQVFGRGKQVFISIEGDQDGSLDVGDYIELYARANDSWLDSLIYDVPSHVANPDYSLFNDTATYFLTIGSQIGLRTSFSSASDFENFQPIPWCNWSSRVSLHNEYLAGKQDANGISLPWYEQGEGWFDYRFGAGGTHEKDLATSHPYTGLGAPNALVKTISASASSAQGFPNHHLQVGWGSPFQTMVDTVYYGYQLTKSSFSLSANQLGSNTTKIVHRSVDDLGVATDYHAVSFISIDYSRTFDFSNLTRAQFSINNFFSQNYGRIDFTGWQGSPRVFVLSDGATNESSVSLEGSTWKSLIPFNNGLTKVIVLNSNDYSVISNLSRVTPTSFFTDFGAINADSAYIIVSHPTLMDAVQNYAAYRQSTGHDVVVVNVEELYLQYAAGIEKNPIALRRFCKDVISSWSTPPSNLFLIGKSIHEMSLPGSIGSRNNLDYYARNLVPTYGWPSSDLAITSGLGTTLFETAIPTGRIAANNSQQVLEYLNKVIEMENQAPAAWQKNILHFGGGTILYEQQLFSTYLNNYKLVAKDTSFAGNVHTFLKSTTDPIQMNLSDSIQYLINGGSTLLTFFGHASSTGFDQNIDEPESYSNQGKYPLLIGNSCYTGNIHLPESQSTSERFVLAPGRGTIAFLAKSDLGIPGYLDLFTNNFYRNIFQEFYGKSIGRCIQESVRDFQVAGDFYRENTALTFAFHGDPALRLYSWDKPDYAINTQSVLFDPPQITAQIDSFKVKVVIENIGKATHRQVGIELVRHYPNGLDSSYVIVTDEILNHDTIVFTLPIDPLISVGQNVFDVFVDYPANLIEELNDVSNNIVQGVSISISSGDLIPVYPFQFAVIPSSSVTLKASTGYALEPLRSYKMQLDTTDTFDSPFLMEANFIESGGVVEWPLPIPLNDHSVYFWRCSSDSLDPEHPYRWRESSFQFIEGENGWGQAHFFQFKNDGLSQLEYDRINRVWNYNSTDLLLKCQVFGNPATSYEALGTRFQIDLDVQDYSGAGYTPALMVAVMDSVTLLPWESNFNGTNPDHDFSNTLSSAISRNRPEKYFIFQQNDPVQMNGCLNLLSSQIPDGDYVLVYTWMYATYETWPSGLLESLQSLGAVNIGSGNDSVPFIFFVKKGQLSSAQEVIASFQSDFIELQSTMSGTEGLGILRSPIIGPTFDWGSADWQLLNLENELGDSTVIRLIGISPNNQETLLAEWPEIPNEILDLGSIANASEYPTLRMEAELHDVAHLTPPQTVDWHILHEPIPECALNPPLGFLLSNDSLIEGEVLKVAVAIQNISPTPMDSLLVHYWVEDQNRQIHSISYPRQAPLLSGQILLDTVLIDTRNLVGLNSIFIEANPRIGTTQSYDQLEQYHFNNLLQIPFLVQADRINPLLDVTFDGVHILNGDIVSALPDILVTLDDENTFLISSQESDTSQIKLFLQLPDGAPQSIYFSSPELDWIPASAPSNKCSIRYNPQLKTDGKHQLIVQAQDKSGNASGASDYRIGFEVINKPSISEVLNYPNPFSTRTQFVFTLTGNEVPDELKIQIMTVGGDVVREILGSELGPIRIGRNLTEYWWNGTDEFGDQLANGVYLYRVIAKLHGQPMEQRETGASSWFTKGYGKMYLMR